jgi:hypothetical protein
MPGVIGPPVPSNPGLGERPIRQVPDGRGGWITTKLTDEEMRAYDARERERIDGGAAKLAEQYKARLYGDPEADAAARQARATGPDPKIRLDASRQALTEALGKLTGQREARDRAQRHLTGAEKALAALIEHHRRLDGNRVAAVTRALAENRDPEDEGDILDNVAVTRAQDRAATARRALEGIAATLAQAEQAVTRAAQEVHSAAEIVLQQESEGMADRLVQAERQVTALRADLRSLSMLWVAPPAGRAHPVQLTSRVVRALNNPDSSPAATATDWAARLRGLIAG